MNDIDANLIDGQWRAGRGETFETVNPATLQPQSLVRFATVADAADAVDAAHAAFPAWSALAHADRAAALIRLRDALARRTDDFANVIADEVGSPLWFSQRIGLSFPLTNLELAIDGAAELFRDQSVGSSAIVREPYGVVVAITPWNAPILQIVAKVGAALAAGCTVVLKPSEYTPQTSRLFAEAVEEAGVPPGVFNMVVGAADVAEALVTHPLVDVVSFTGSVGVGQRVAAAAAGDAKKVILELGGKSATIILDDADLARAAAVFPTQVFANSGQVCVSQSRLLVPAALLRQFEELLVAEVAAWGLGDPRSAETKLGPVASAAQYDRVRGYIDQAIAEGARLVLGGAEPVPQLPGYFIRPTIFSDVTPAMTIAREEVFGPVLAIMPYDDIDEAVSIANSTPFGLSGGVWGQDVERASGVARRMRTGQVAINGAPQNLATPFGGYKRSGYGRENGRYGVEEFLQYKVIHGAVSA